VAWSAIERFAVWFDRCVILNAPHPAVMQIFLKQDLGQIWRSWYALAFLIPGLPEFLLKRNDFRLLERSLKATSRPGAFDHSDMELARAAWGQPGALRSMILWYRASFRTLNLPLPDLPIIVPTLILWGVKDRFLGSNLARSSYAQCQDASIEWFEDATHWMHHEEPERVNHLILEFLSMTKGDKIGLTSTRDDHPATGDMPEV